MFSCTCLRPVSSQKPRRGRRLPAVLLAAALLLASGAAQADTGRGPGAGRPAGLLESVRTWLLDLLGPQGRGRDGSTASTTSRGTLGTTTANGSTIYDPRTDAGSRMDPNG